MRILFLALAISVSSFAYAGTSLDMANDTTEARELPEMREESEDSTFKSLELALQNPGQVRVLILKRKGLKVFPTGLEQFPNLVKLNLNGNKIKEIPAEVAMLANLVELDVADNKILTINEAIGDLKALRVLHLGNNDIEKLPMSLSQLKKLQILDLWKNNLSVEGFSSGLSELKNLQSVDLRSILFNEEQQKKISSMMPNADILFSPACNCK